MSISAQGQQDHPGQRLADEVDWRFDLPHGAYWRRSDGVRRTWVWYAVTPNGLLCNLTNHTVNEHEDGTVSVSPSIEVVARGQHTLRWHGYLERGVWRSVQ